MADQCEKLCIPAYLHRNERLIDHQFNMELIYRRFSPFGKPEDWKKDRSISASIFPVKDDSCNRSKYSKKAEDVLFNTREEDNGAHYTRMGVLSFCSSTIDKFSGVIKQNDVSRNFTMKLVHDPLECMYPHCEIIVLENGEIIDKSKPKSIKTLIRDVLIENIKIILEPSIDE